MTQISFALIISIFAKRFDEKTFKFWIFATRDDFSYIFITLTKNDLMRLICLNENKRISNAWLRFDINVKNDRRISTFANSNVSHCFIAQRIVDQLKLKLQYFLNKIRLKNDKTIDVVDFVSYEWNKNKFHTIFDYLVFNIKNDLILNENFWQKYRLIFDYDTLKMRVTNKNNIHLLSSILNNRSHLQIFENQSSKAQILDKRVFERFIRKNATFYLYVVRKKIKKKSSNRQKNWFQFNILSITRNWTKHWKSTC